MNQLMGGLRWAVLSVLLALIAGCASLSGKDLVEPYSAQMTDMRHAVQSGQLKQAISDVDVGSTSDTNYYLKQLELGRLQQLAGHYSASQKHFSIVEKHQQWLESQAQFRLSSGVQDSIAVLSNDTARSYQIPVYERVMLHHYQALNYLHQNDLSGALVEVRKGELLQQKAIDQHSSQLSEIQSQYRDQVQSTLAQYPSMQALLKKSKSAYQNGYTYLLSSALYLAANQPNDAYIDLKRALQIAPDNPAIGALTTRLAKQLGMPDLANLERRFKPLSLTSHQGLVMVLTEQNLIPYRRQVALHLPILVGDRLQYLSVAFPYLPDEVVSSPPLQINLAGQVTTIESATQLQALAAHSLKEQLPGMILRQVIRLSSKTVLANKITKQNPWLGLVANLYNAVTEHADTRSWESLPAAVGFSANSVDAGTYQLRFVGIGKQVPIQVKANRVTLVIVSQIGQTWVSQNFLL
ncbi:COG3014 family protein [Celerinatantimonas yamalensis]|uniref:LPP20 lipoprotein n=1 Tax=Celerinatantimonas yamalensis TaxID=559956 RepID=A0ABW9G3B1_9GAMM